MVKVLPDNVKEVLGQLTAPQQVTIRAYIATLREEAKALEETIRTRDDPDPRAHYHGNDRCTADHGDEQDHKKHKHEDGGHDHKEHDHEEHDHDGCCGDDHDHKGHDHKEHDHKGHDHKGHDHKEHDHKGHDHKEHDHKEHDHKGCGENHDHKGHDHKEHDHKEHDHKGCGEDHDHKEHNHDNHKMEHAHAHEHATEIPAWKKKAIEMGSNDPSAAPFGGNWTTESSVNAVEDMKE